jgi:hypothetical protein
MGLPHRMQHTTTRGCPEHAAVTTLGLANSALSATRHKQHCEKVCSAPKEAAKLQLTDACSGGPTSRFTFDPGGRLAAAGSRALSGLSQLTCDSRAEYFRFFFPASNRSRLCQQH